MTREFDDYQTLLEGAVPQLRDTLDGLLHEAARQMSPAGLHNYLEAARALAEAHPDVAWQLVLTTDAPPPVNDGNALRASPALLEEYFPGTVLRMSPPPASWLPDFQSLLRIWLPAESKISASGFRDRPALALPWPLARRPSKISRDFSVRSYLR